MRVRCAVVAAFVLSIGASVFAQEWVEFVSREDRFTITFPVQPTVTQTTYKSQFGADLPARIYMRSRDRTDLRQPWSQRPRKRNRAPGRRNVSRRRQLDRSGLFVGRPRGRGDSATWQFMQRDAKVTYFNWNNVDLVEGHMLTLTNNKDKSRTSAAIYMHENRLYILEGTVPDGYPEPAFFQQSVAWIDENGNGIRYQTLYHNGFPKPPVGRGGQGGPAGQGGRGGNAGRGQ